MTRLQAYYARKIEAARQMPLPTKATMQSEKRPAHKPAGFERAPSLIQVSIKRAHAFRRNYPMTRELNIWEHLQWCMNVSERKR